MTVLLTLLVLAVGSNRPVQGPQAAGSPKEVVEQYIRMGDDGSLLTAEGWKKAQELFAEPKPLPTNKVVHLVSKGGSVGQLWVKENHAEVEQMWRDPLGSIDSALRYLPPPKTSSAGTIFLYRLVLTDKHWEFAPDGRPTRQVTGPPQWKIEGSYTQPWATVDAAIRYVTQMRDRATDPVIKKNGDQTLAILERHDHSR